VVTLQLRAAVTLAVLTLLTGCPHRPLEFGPRGRITDPTIILSALSQRRAAVHSVQGEAKANISTPEGSGKITQFIVAEAPDRVRLESISFFGDPIAILSSDGRQFALHDVKRNEFVQGEASAENVSRLLPLRLPPEELVSLVLGVPPLPAKPQAIALDVNEKDRGYELTVTDGEQTEVLLVDTLSLRPKRVDVAGRPALSPYRAEFDDYDDKLNLPNVVRLFAPDGKSKVELKWREREVNRAIEPEAFVQEVPEGATVVAAAGEIEIQ
jgi:outer membrane lipoprotein-sorting protein